jgi:hypothetical protein
MFKQQNMNSFSSKESLFYFHKLVHFYRKMLETLKKSGNPKGVLKGSRPTGAK